MPIYEYRCSSCGFQKEYLQKITDPVMTVCPGCGKATFSKMLSAVGFQLKGSGWYATDFKSSGTKPAAKANGEAGAAKTDGGKASDAKPESKSESKSESTSSSGTSTGGCGSGCSCH